MANSAFSHGTCVESSSFQRAATADARSGGPSIKRYLGELMAAAASKIAIALAELHNGGLTPATKQHGGDLVAQLYGLRQYMAGYWGLRCHGTSAAAMTSVP